ncbi:hypothetical protein DFH09DRAFT_1098593 [Mycena vulgaris]|nr:hypothetical protein DFH09DRAFT_1098593 [Mycena vulgaris]
MGDERVAGRVAGRLGGEERKDGANGVEAPSDSTSHREVAGEGRQPAQTTARKGVDEHVRPALTETCANEQATRAEQPADSRESLRVRLGLSALVVPECGGQATGTTVKSVIRGRRDTATYRGQQWLGNAGVDERSSGRGEAEHRAVQEGSASKGYCSHRRRARDEDERGAGVRRRLRRKNSGTALEMSAANAESGLRLSWTELSRSVSKGATAEKHKPSRAEGVWGAGAVRGVIAAVRIVEREEDAVMYGDGRRGITGGSGG